MTAKHNTKNDDDDSAQGSDEGAVLGPDLHASYLTVYTSLEDYYLNPILSVLLYDHHLLYLTCLPILLPDLVSPMHPPSVLSLYGSIPPAG